MVRHQCSGRAHRQIRRVPRGRDKPPLPRPNNGFFEWKREGKSKIPYWFKPTDTDVSFFAGIWNRWEGEHKGEPVAFVSFAIINCEPNSLVAPLHDRMPAILRPEDCQSWVFDERDVALKAIGPYPAQLMSARQLETAINNSRNEGPELLEAVA